MTTPRFAKMLRSEPEARSAGLSTSDNPAPSSRPGEELTKNWWLVPPTGQLACQLGNDQNDRDLSKQHRDAPTVANSTDDA